MNIHLIYSNEKTGIHCKSEFVVKPLVNLYQEQGSVPGTMWTKTPSDELILISRTSTQIAPGLKCGNRCFKVSQNGITHFDATTILLLHSLNIYFYYNVSAKFLFWHLCAPWRKSTSPKLHYSVCPVKPRAVKTIVT